MSLLWAGLAGCTSLSEGQERLPPPVPANERVTLRQNPNATLLERMDNQASEINRKRNIEQFDSNSPAMTPTTLRPLLLPLAPIDSARHFLYWPMQREVQPLPPANKP
ncbi:hypothetical protein [Pontibacter litorisediminis]|uniref:hypothetical protein n=1 Tax=Pontibacter litorisediminis TaxID=1846260 RepID=UPI0023ED4340|nr:hypothetical protein [Pontibacter litorisediminis]